MQVTDGDKIIIQILCKISAELSLIRGITLVGPERNSSVVQRLTELGNDRAEELSAERFADLMKGGINES